MPMLQCNCENSFGIFNMERITVNDHTYAVYIHQQKKGIPYLIMLHGFMGDHRVFKHLIDDLCNSCNPITIDLLGHGKTSKPEDPSPYSASNQTVDLVEILNRLNLGPLFLYGYSMGGRLALQTVLPNCELFKGLILESTNCGILDPKKRKERRQIDAERAEAITNDFDDFLSEWKKLKLFESPVPRNESIHSFYQQIQSEQPPSALTASLKGFGTGSMTPVCNKLQNITRPILLIAGSADEKYQCINQHLSDQLPNATFSTVKAGHRVHLDNPNALVESIKYFITN